MKLSARFFRYRHLARLRSVLIPFIILAIGWFTAFDALASWPTYRHDRSRSGSTTEKPPTDPRLLWSYQSPSRPVPAWGEPALWDGWAKIHDLKNRQVFDKAFQVAVVDGRVYFGSSVDDKVYCLDAATGEPRWTFYTEGPVRLAPTVAGSRLYVGGDDGYVYCLDKDSGQLIWKRSVVSEKRRVAGNGRIVSPWAIRTSVVAMKDAVYCGAGVIPSEGVFVAALSADNGDLLWKTKMSDLPAQGYMLASPTRLYVVTARDTPVVFDVKSGKRLFKVKGGTGGTYALLTGDTLLYGPNKTGDVSMVGDKQDVLASFKGNHMIVARPWSYLQAGDKLSALDRGTYVKLYAERMTVSQQRTQAAKLFDAAKESGNQREVETRRAELEELTQQHKDLGERLQACLKWTADCDCPNSLILAGGVLVAGGEGRVIAVDATSGDPLWSRDVPGAVYGLAVSEGRLFVSTDQGAIHCFADHDGTPASQSRDPLPARIVRRQYPGPLKLVSDVPREIHGPFAEFVTPTSVRISWDTSEPMTATLKFGSDLKTARTWTRDERSAFHEFVVDSVQRDVVYQFQVGGTTAGGRVIRTPSYRFDAHLNYLPAPLPQRPSPYADAKRSAQMTEIAKHMLQACSTHRGYALVVGATDGHLAYELARLSELQIVIVEPDTEVVQLIRNRMDACGLHGLRVTVHQRELDDLHYGPFLANLIVSERMLTTDQLTAGELSVNVEDLYRCLRPAGGTIFWGRWDEVGTEETSIPWAGFERLQWNAVNSDAGHFWTHRRGKLPRTGEWTHQYAGADNSACSRDDLIRGEMNVLWWGRPGARPMPDRGNRNPPPVSANGRLYIQGNRTLFGLDAYNGTILWAKQIPTMRRANMPRDGSNMAADDDNLYVAIGDRCVAIDGQTGQRLKDLEVPEFTSREYDWGYVARVGPRLFGTGVREGSHYLGDSGEWYEGSGHGDIARVTSDGMFSIDAYSGELQWVYHRGVLINSTITIADGRIYLIESRNNAAQKASTGRLLDEVLENQVLVALNAATGEVIWEKPYDFSKCRHVTYMTHAKNTLLITGTDAENTFHTYAFDASDGRELWQHQAPDQKGHHTGQLAHPTIVGDLVYFNKHTYELRTGKVLGVHNFDWHGCGIMSASNHSVFSRYEYHGMLDLKTNKRHEFLGIRSGCWLSMIPSGGVLLAPETSAGCSCGHSLQTSIAYVPASLANVSPELGTDDAQEAE